MFASKLFSIPFTVTICNSIYSCILYNYNVHNPSNHGEHQTLCIINPAWMICALMHSLTNAHNTVGQRDVVPTVCMRDGKNQMSVNYSAHKMSYKITLRFVSLCTSLHTFCQHMLYWECVLHGVYLLRSHPGAPTKSQQRFSAPSSLCVRVCLALFFKVLFPW